jgi:hypothetical protein
LKKLSQLDATDAYAVLAAAAAAIQCLRAVEENAKAQARPGQSPQMNPPDRQNMDV